MTTFATVPVRVRYRREGDSGEGQRIVAYRTVCSCGWKSPGRPNVAECRQDYAVHKLDAHNEHLPPPAPHG